MIPVFVFGVAGIHLIAALLVMAARSHWPMMLGFVGLAYTLGMRHGFDADHIAAIDGATRHLTARGHNARGVGFYFSLGHSTVVLLLAAWIARATETGGRALPLVRALGGRVGLVTSSVFMLLIAGLNIAIFHDTLKASRQIDAATRGATTSPPLIGGLFMRVFGRGLRLITRAPQMYGVGFLFGLGMDTASEVALLAIAAAAGARDLPMSAVLALPVAFAAGMSLVDTAEGMFMVRAYGWAQDQPLRRARYNLVVTGFTAVAAVTIGAMELSDFSIFGTTISTTAVGVSLVATFPALWLVAALRSRLRASSSSERSR